MSMRAVAVAILAIVAGCDGVFGLQKLQTPDTTDAAAADAPPNVVTFIGEGHSHTLLTTRSLTYPMTVPDGAGRILLLYYAAGSSCPPGTITLATVNTFAFNGLPASQVRRIEGTPCSSLASSSEVWILLDPPVGTYDVAITLSTTVPSIHSAALLFTNVDQTTPIRSCEDGSGRSTSAIVTVPSAPNDLVASFAAQGTGITGPLSGTRVFLQNVNDFTTLNNSSASTLPGADPTVDAAWLFSLNDEWQALACSVRPAQ